MPFWSVMHFLNVVTKKKKKRDNYKQGFSWLHFLIADVPLPDFDNPCTEKLGFIDYSVNYNSQEAMESTWDSSYL